MRESFHCSLQWHVVQRVDDLRIFRICLKTDNDEARYADRFKECFALSLNFGGVHRKGGNVRTVGTVGTVGKK
jgi:hypothetical protein